MSTNELRVAIRPSRKPGNCGYEVGGGCHPGFGCRSCEGILRKAWLATRR